MKTITALLLALFFTTGVVLAVKPVDTISIKETSAYPDGLMYTAWQPNTTANPAVTRYEIYAGATIQKATKHIGTVWAPVTTFAWIPQPGTMKCIRLRACNRDGCGPKTSGACLVSQTIGVIPRTGWSLVYADSQELVGENGAAVNALDGSSASIWHTQWYQGNPPPPHEIQINLGAAYSISGFRYLPRQDADINGTIAQYEFYVSATGPPFNWVRVANGTFATSKTEKEVAFASVTGQYVRLRALSEVNGKAWTSAAEINVLGQ